MTDILFYIQRKKERNWTRYLNNKQTIFTEFPDLTEEEFNSNSFVSNGFLYNLDDFFKNSEHIKLGLIVKDEYLKDIKKDNFEFALSIGMIIILISVPIGIIVSIPTSKLYMNINTLYKENLRHIDTIDKHVATMVVNLNKNITDVSTALCKISGYSKEELLGQTPSVFKSGNMDVQVYKELWNKISQRYVWSGELENKTKSGEPYWVDVTILPNLDEKNNLISFTSIMEDITDKKLIEKISQTDKLTQLYNRVKLDDSLDYEINRYIRYKDIFSVILIDIDYFKSVNDTYGHLVGDNVLVELSNQLKIHCRNTDILGRWGGEEFMIICTDTNIKGAIELAEHLRKTVDTFEFEIVKHKTISIGVSEVTNADNIETLIKRVDENLYKAKKEGRNRVISDS
ncbi:MAG: diguanylate cyclase [Thiovulaceae bacterium]|nr:diguanylate cyclase [Sulfurimonadaceae bacterium]